MSENIVVLDGQKIERIPVKTEVVFPETTYEELVSFATPHLKSDDTLFISEKVIAIIENRLVALDDINPSFLSKILSRYVTSGGGSNLAHAKGMEMAIKEVGVLRILAATVAAIFTKPFGVKGMFYRVAGDKVRGIDYPHEEMVKPFNRYIILNPLEPQKTAQMIGKIVDNDVVIVDANYKGINILGKTNKNVTDEEYIKMFQGNPVGQDDEQTPLCIIRKK